MSFVLKDKREANMKKIIVKSVVIAAIISAAVSLIGFLTNLFTYKNFRRMFLCRQLTGGEWMGWQGFGLLMNKTFPLTTMDDPGAGGSTWLTFDPSSLIVTLAGIFLLGFIVSLVIRIIIRNIKKAG